MGGPFVESCDSHLHTNPLGPPTQVAQDATKNVLKVRDNKHSKHSAEHQLQPPPPHQRHKSNSSYPISLSS